MLLSADTGWLSESEYASNEKGVPLPIPCDQTAEEVHINTNRTVPGVYRVELAGSISDEGITRVTLMLYIWREVRCL